jgi:RNA polymerase II transcription mediator complex subunit 9
LTTKDIPAATDDLKSGLKKARALVAQLPDMDRGVEEQEVEIRELEARIEEQRRVLEGLKAMAGGGLVETWWAGVDLGVPNLDLWNFTSVVCSVMIAALEMMMPLELVLKATASEWLVQAS